VELFKREKAMLKHGILGLLSYGDMTGYQIMTVFRDSLSHFWVAQTSQIYRELQGLEKNGWIAAVHVEQTGKPDKNVLSITAAGREELLRWLREDTNRSLVRNAMLMKTFFRGECDLDENIAYFKSLPEQECLFTKESGEAEAVSDQYRDMLNLPEKALFWKFTIRFGVMYEEMVRAWCEECIRELEGFKHEDSAD
jgi:transcriptional regulator, padR-like family